LIFSESEWVKYAKACMDGITPEVLLERLKELEDEGLLLRSVDTTAFPVKTEYTLTERGLEIVNVIRGIKHWALKWKIDNIPRGEQDCKVCEL
jgi:DNA-binding HxlR family transcriptional regulator